MGWAGGMAESPDGRDAKLQTMMSYRGSASAECLGMSRRNFPLQLAPCGARAEVADGQPRRFRVYENLRASVAYGVGEPAAEREAK